jgi:hypothetical protein
MLPPALIRQLLEDPVIVGCLAVLALTCISFPFLIRMTFRIPQHPQLEPIDPENDELPPGAARILLETAGALAAEGFVPLAYYRQVGARQHALSCWGLYINRTTGDAARATVDCVRWGHTARVRAWYVVMISKFSRGIWVVTTNFLDQSQAFRPPPYQVTFILPGVDPGRLAHIHQVLVEREEPGLGKVPVVEGDPIAYHKIALARLMNHLVETGYMYLNERTETYQLTWIGTLVATCKLIWPIRPIRRSLVRARARRLLRSIGDVD